MDLRFDGVGVRYAGGPPVLAEISFTVAPGSFCVILGASGAGKSTLLRTVNGLVAPSHGRVLVGGTAVDRKTKRGLRRRIGMIHQHFALVPRASVASNVMAGAAPELPLWRIMTGIWPVALQRRAMELLHATGLGQE
ncbi:MAG: ATP-binding cassette domain-containing protein, partial [Sphingomonadaceae bacterium]